jgi:hypothetical protein
MGSGSLDTDGDHGADATVSMRMPTAQIPIPSLAEHGAASSEALVARMRKQEITDDEIANYLAFYHTKPIPPRFNDG